LSTFVYLIFQYDVTNYACKKREYVNTTNVIQRKMLLNIRIEITKKLDVMQVYNEAMPCRATRIISKGKLRNHCI